MPGGYTLQVGALLLMVTLMISLPSAAAAQAMQPPPARDTALVAVALSAGANGDWEPDSGTLDALSGAGRVVLEWYRLRAGAGQIDEYLHWLDTRSDWPLAAHLQRIAETRIADAPAERVRAFFESREPLTAEGHLARAEMLDEAGETAAATEIVARLWRDFTLDEALEARLLSDHAATLEPLHAERLDNLLWRGAHEAAERMLDHVPSGLARLAEARLALQQRSSGVNALIDAVPSALADDPGLAHDRFQWRMHAGLRDSAGALLLERSTSPEGLGRPEAWARWRIYLVRRALADGDPELAYRLAASHHLDDGVQFADLEWLAGFIALRHLEQPAEALRHFRSLRVRVSSPISLGRAGYWEAQAQEALGNAPAAEAAILFAAEYWTSFYGQLAAERAGIVLDPTLANGRDYPDLAETPIADSEMFEAAMLLRDMGEWHEARRLVIHLAWSLTREDDFGALSEYLLALGEANMALNVAKIAVQRGYLLPRAYFPLNGLETADLPADPALVLAIARRESEFDPGAVSPADARGLMQVLPGTGRMMARKLGVAGFLPEQLTEDPELNARLGAAYLQQLTEQFGPSLALVAAGYNAGPGRPRQWIERLGDPRDPSVDIVEWLESVPFAETRNYIMRVAESLVVYRARLAAEPTPIAMEALLRGR